MNTALWIVQGLLAAMFLLAGNVKAFKYEAAKAQLPWVKDVPKGLVTFIGYAEQLGGVGLILPLATGAFPFLTPAAACGIGALMVLAAGFHARRKEYPAAAMNLLFLAMAAFVAYGRFAENF